MNKRFYEALFSIRPTLIEGSKDLKWIAERIDNLQDVAVRHRDALYSADVLEDIVLIRYRLALASEKLEKIFKDLERTRGCIYNQLT